MRGGKQEVRKRHRGGDTGGEREGARVIFTRGLKRRQV